MDGRGRARDLAATQHAIPFLLEVVDPKSGLRPDVVASALIALGRAARDPSVVPAILRWTEDAEAPSLVLESAALAAGLLRRSSREHQFDGHTLDHVRERLLDLFDQPWAPYRVRCFAVLALGLLGDQPFGYEAARDGRRVVGALWDRLGAGYPTWDLTVCLLTALGMQPVEGIPDALAQDLRDIVQGKRVLKQRWNACERSHALSALARLGVRGIDGFLLRTLGNRRTDAEVRRAAWIAIGSRSALMDAGDVEAAVPVLLRALQREREPLTEGLGLIALGRLGAAALRTAPAREEAAEAALRHLLTEMRTGSAGAQGYCALALGLACRPGEGLPAAGEKLKIEAERALVERLTETGDPVVRGAAAVALGLMEATRAVAPLRDVLADTREAEALRGHAAVALGQVGRSPSDVTLALAKALLGSRGDVLRSQAALGLSLLAAPMATSQLIREMRVGKTEHLLAQVTVAIGRMDDLSALEPLLEVARDRSRSELTQALAVVSVGMLVDPERRPSIQRLAEDANYPARTEALHEVFSIL